MRREGPDFNTCTCGSRRITTENWRGMNRIVECLSCHRKVVADTWREAAAKWNNPKGGES